MIKEDITGLEIEKKFLMKNLPDKSLFKDFNSWTEEVIQSYYPRENNKWGRIERVVSSKEGLFYMQNWKEFISPGVCDETEFRITEEQYKEKYKDCVKYVYKTRTFIEYNEDIVLEIDDFHNLKLCVLEVELPDINNEIEFPDWIKDLIISEVTQISNFSNEKLALPIDNTVDYSNGVLTSFTNLKKSLSDTYIKYGDKKVLIIGRNSYSGNEIANEIKNGTEFGIKQMGKLINLSINLISRNKITQDS